MRTPLQFWQLGAMLLLLAPVAATAQLGAGQPGIALATQFNQWRSQAQGPISGTGKTEAFTIEAAAATFTLPGGASFMPFSVGEPLAVDVGANAETVALTAVYCPSTGETCSLTAVFTKPHPGRFAVASGSDGLQEAINYQATHGGGIVEANSGFQGSVPALLPLLHLPGNVLLIDTTGGQWTYYGQGGGGSPHVIASFSSSTGAALGGLNGAQFASAFDFAAAAPGGTLSAGIAATVTPQWSLPPGLTTGDSLYVSGGTGSPEAVTLTNTGTFCPGGTINSICFTPANAHSGAWTVQSATNGLQEALTVAGAGGWVIDDLPQAVLYAPLVIRYPVRLTGFNGSVLQQLSPNTDVIDIGTASGPAVRNVILEYLTAEGVSGGGSDSGVAFHCVSCALTQFLGVVGEDAHDGIYFDSANGNAFDNLVEGAHFTADYYGVHLVGGSANRDTFVGDTVDHNTYGVFDDGGWDHVWTGDDIEYNTDYGYWQQVSQPANWSGHNVVLHGDYFEDNGSGAGQGDVFLGQLVNGGTGNNGAGCINCEVTDNLFNATNASVTALNLGAVTMTVSENTYSGYAAANVYATITGPSPNFSRVLLIGDCGTLTASAQCAGAQPNTITQLGYGALTLGGTDQLTDSFGTELHDTTIESPTGIVRVRGLPGGATAANPAQLDLDGNSTASAQDWLRFRNQGTDDWAILSDISGDKGDTFCPVFNLVNPASGHCQLYVGPDAHFQFSGLGNAPGGDINPAGDYTFRQMANGDSGVMIQRFTDSSPTGFLLDIEDSTDSHPLFRVDTAGNVTTSGTVQAGALDQPAQNTYAGTCTMAAGTTCSRIFTAAYATVPLCFATVQSTTPIAAGCTVSGSAGAWTALVTAATSNSFPWNILLVGNAN